MSNNDNFNNLKKIISKKTKEKITKESDLKQLGIDSLDILDLIVEVEKKFGFSINDDELLSIKNVDDILKLIESK